MKKNESKVAGVPGLDPTLPSVSLELGSELFTLCYDFNAIVQVYNATGVNLLDSFELSNPAVFRAALWAAMLPAQPEMTLEQVGKLIRFSSLKPITEALYKTWTGSLPEPDGVAVPTGVQS